MNGWAYSENMGWKRMNNGKFWDRGSSFHGVISEYDGRLVQCADGVYRLEEEINGGTGTGSS